MADLVDALARQQPDLVRLAECVSLAAGVDRNFLRRARLRFLPESAAGLEADLWFSLLVEAAGVHSLLLDPEAAQALRDRLLRQSPQRLADIHEFTTSAHARAPAIVRLYEELLWSYLSLTPMPEHRLAQQMGAVLNAVSSDGAAADDAGRWVLHYMPRLPAAVLRRGDVWRLQVVSCERLGLEPPPDPLGRSSYATAEARALVQRSVQLGVRARSDGIVVSRPPSHGSRTIGAVGTRQVRLDALSPLGHSSEPVRLELHEEQTLHLPFSVVQRVSQEGVVDASLAHPGAVLGIAVSSTADPAMPISPSAQCAVLLPDGTIVVHGHDSAEIVRLSADAYPTARRNLALSTDGTVLSWVEGDVVRQFHLVRHTESAVGRLASEDAIHHLAAGAGTVLYWTDESAGTLVRVDAPLAEGQLRTWTFQGLAVDLLWISQDGARLAVVDPSTILRTWLVDGERNATVLASRVTAVSGTANGSILVWATDDGRVWSQETASDTTRGPLLVGRAPWRVVSLAVSDDRARVAGAGRDHRLMDWSLVEQDQPAAETLLRFRADRVASVGSGWVVAGAGGPVELSVEDGRRYLVTPDPEPAPEDDSVPLWARGCVFVEASLADGLGPPVRWIQFLQEWGVGCVAVGQLPEDLGNFADLLAVARERGVRVVLDLGDEPLSSSPLQTVRRWLDRGVDGLRLVGNGVIEVRTLEDIRHLLDGYDERLLMYAPAGGAVAQEENTASVFHTEPANELVASLGFTIRNRELPDTRFAQVVSALRDDISGTLALLAEADAPFQWSYALPPGLRAEDRRLAASILLSLPGGPCLPLELLAEDAKWRSAAPLRTMLELRRNHLALSRGVCQVLDLGTDRILGVLRSHGDERVLCLVNLAWTSTMVRLDGEHHGTARLLNHGAVRLLDLFNGSDVPRSADSGVFVTMAAGAVMWFRLTGPPSSG